MHSRLVGCVASLLALTFAEAQVQTADQQKCTVAQNANLRKVAATRLKETGTCLKDGAKGTLPGSIEACVAADGRGKVAKAAAKTDADFGKKCSGTSSRPPMPSRLPPYGVTDPAAVNDAGQRAAGDFLHDVFGPDLDQTTVAEAADEDGAKCQQALTKQLTKCADALLAEFVRCKTNGLKADSDPIDGPADIAACVGLDPDGKIAKQCDLRLESSPGKFTLDGLRKAMATKCVAAGVDLAQAAPGCSQSDLESAHACADAAARCRVCLAVEAADGVDAACDQLDDGVANDSCGVTQTVIGRHTCSIDPASGFLFDTAIFNDIFGLSGTIDVECGAIDPGTGRAPCSCDVVDIPPIPVVPNIGVACVRPAAGCPTGEISCNGGGQYNRDLTSHHDIGACTGNADCASQCATRCGTDGAGVFESACEGYCRGGSNADAACSDADDCPGGICNGIADGSHGNVCQCACLDVAGDAARPGALHCNVGVDIDVELAEPCGDGDVLLSVGPRCIGFTTETAAGRILDANDVAGDQLPPGEDNFQGMPLACADLATAGTSGLALVAAAHALDVELAGDISFGFSFACQ